MRAIVPAKCILSGEHIILTKGKAIVSPFNKYNLSLNYKSDSIQTVKTISGEGGNSMQVILWPVLSKAYEIVEKDIMELSGLFQIHSSIPPCGGLGFSAALCVAVAKWAVYKKLIKESELFEFATELECLFHGKSSGLDIAGVLAMSLIQYTSDHRITVLNQTWKPKLYISSSGEKSFSQPCIKKVQSLREKDPIKADEIDTKMLTASNLIEQALKSNEPERFDELSKGLNLGSECFYDWELVSSKLDEHVKELKKYAQACKIVGAGYGGHVLSLWESELPPDLPFKLYPLS